MERNSTIASYVTLIVFIMCFFLVALTIYTQSTNELLGTSSLQLKLKISSVTNSSMNIGLQETKQYSKSEQFETKGDQPVYNMQGEVLGTGDENDACRMSPIGCGGEYDVSGGWYPLCATSQFKIKYPPPISGNTSTVRSTMSIVKVTHDNQVTAGVGEPGDTGVYQLWWDDQGTADFSDDKLMINYPPRQNSVDWIIGSIFTPANLEKYKLLIKPPTVDMAATETGDANPVADTGPFAVNAHIGASGIKGVPGFDKNIETQVVIQDWLGGAINPDKANKLGDIAWDSLSSPGTKFEGRANKAKACQDKVEQYSNSSVVKVPADNYIACVDKEDTFKGESEATFSPAHWRACREGTASCDKTHTATLDLTSATGSNYSCKKGHCLDAWNDKHIALLLTSGKLAELGWVASDIDTSKSKTKGDVYIKDLYAATNCIVSRNGEKIGINCIHPGPSYVQAYVMIQQLQMSPVEVNEKVDDDGKVIRASMMDTFWHAVGEYWQNMGVLCRE